MQGALEVLEEAWPCAVVFGTGQAPRACNAVVRGGGLSVELADVDAHALPAVGDVVAVVADVW